MKSNIKLLIVFGIVVVVLAAAVVFLNVFDKESDSNDSDTNSAAEELTSTLLYDKNPQDINTVTITNDKSSYKVERIGEGESSVWTVMEFFNLPVNAVTLDTIINASATMTAQMVVTEDAEDLSIYGLDKPRAVVKTEFTDSSGTVKEIYIGNETPTVGKTYFCFAGEKKVYTVNTSEIKCFLDDKYSCINRTVYTAFTPSDANDTTDYTRINKMVISRQDIDYDIVIEYDKRLDDPNAMTGNSSTHVMTSPVKLDLSPEKSSDVTSLVFGLAAAAIEAINPTAEQLAEYGLGDEPFADVFMDISGGDFHLVLGNQIPDKTGRYGYAQDIDIIYVFNNESIPWATVMPLDITTLIITSNYIYGINTIDIVGSGTDAHFTMTGSEDADFAVKLNGNDVDKAAFKDFYQFILRAPAEQLYSGDVPAEPDLSITIKSATNTDILEFYNLENRRTAISLNGNVSFTCKTAYLERLIENYHLFEKGESLINTW